MTSNSRGLLTHSHRQVSLMFLLLVKFFIWSSFTLAATETSNLSKHPVVIIISYDGFRYDYMNKTSTPYLDQVKRNGVSVPYMRIQLSAFTYPNHQSIATGLYPEVHGIVANTMYDPLYDKELSGYVDEPGYWNFSSDSTATRSSVVPLYTSNELAGDGRYSGSMMWPAGQEGWGENNTKVTHLVNYNVSRWDWEWEVDQVMKWITHPTKPANLVYLYIEEPDYTGHRFGPEGPEIVQQIQRIDNVTGYLLTQLESLGLKDKVNLIFLSDHGMQEMKPLAIAKFMHVMDNTDNRMYHDYGRGSTFMQIRPVRENDTLRIFNAFNAAAKDNHYTVYLRDEVSKMKPHWHFAHNRRIMPIFMIPEPGYLFEGIAPRNYTWGTHGFDVDEPSMRPFFMAMGPLFKNNSVQEPFDNIDIYPLVCHILNIEPRPNNGSLERVLPLLASSATKASRMSLLLLAVLTGAVINVEAGGVINMIEIDFLKRTSILNEYEI
ncbi:unnamed protein product [Allacma fusca]|uniref:Uncharacterized protein n=1 Tax=Allacma fusca TaxID=39272 RepID=A0A8J2NJV8_9HEXA|nr:unnamed protein product [Allacma fusca]